MPKRPARSQPFSSQSSWPGACASVSMENRQPISAARPSSRPGGSRRSGRQLISTATPCSRHAPNTASGSNSDSRPAAPAPAQQPARAVAQHVHVRVADRGHHPLGHRAGGHPELGVHAGHHHVEPGEQVLALVQRAIVEDVDLDAGQDAERREFGIQPGDQGELGFQPLGGQPIGHREPGRVIGQRDPFVAQRAGRLGHLARRAAPVRPVRVGVAVAAQCRAHGRSRQRATLLRQQPGQVVRLLARGRLRDDPGRGLADPVQRAQGAVAQPALQLARGQFAHHLRGPPEGPDAVGGRPGPFELEGDLAQRGHGARRGIGGHGISRHRNQYPHVSLRTGR